MHISLTSRITRRGLTKAQISGENKNQMKKLKTVIKAIIQKLKPNGFGPVPTPLPKYYAWKIFETDKNLYTQTLEKPHPQACRYPELDIFL